MKAKPGESATPFTPLFPADEVPRILDAVIEASANLWKKCDTEIENRITCRLWQQMKRVEPFRDGALHVNYRAAVADSAADRETPEGEADLQVICFRGPDVYFAIEAKRLRVVYPFGRLESGAAEYCLNGMMRFIIGQYAPRMDSGAMLGYVFDGDVPAARNDVSKAIEQRRDKLKLRAGTGLRQSTILPNRAVDETVHEPDKREFTLYHVLVAV